MRSVDGHTLLAAAGSIVDEATAARIDSDFVATAKVRSPRACAATTGVCARCYGWFSQTRALASPGARIGLAAARAIASLVPGLVGRTVWISNTGDPRLFREEATASGVVRHERLDLVPSPDGDALVMIADRGRMTLLDDCGEEIESFVVVRGDEVEVTDGQRVAARQRIISRSRRRTRLAPADAPAVADRAPSAPLYSIDIWGGLPRFLAILRAEEPESPTILAEVDGALEVIETRERGRRIQIHPDDGGPARHHWLRGRRSEWWPEDGPVARGESLGERGTDVSPRDLLRIFGADWLAGGLHAELRDIIAYSKQPVADVHLEVVVREMLRYGRVESGVRRPALSGVHQLVVARRQRC